MVDDLDLVGIASDPAEADAPLVVDANAVLAVPIAFELLEAISGWGPEILEPHRRVDVAELSEHDAAEVGRKATHVLALPQALSVAVGEMLDHTPIITPYVTRRKNPIRDQLTRG